MSNFTKDCIDLVKEFEGLVLTAYLCPSNIWTIGYGHTEGVKPGDTCTEEQATVWLEEDLVWADQAVTDYVRAPIVQSVHDALTSFTFNVGANAFGGSTLVRRLNNGEDQFRVCEEELPRWINGANGPLLGLVARREAEVELALSGRSEGHVEASEEPETITAVQPISLVDAATYFKGLPHQVEAFEYLEDLLEKAELDEFATIYRRDIPEPIVEEDTILDVKYFYQLDSETPEGFRMCFSSTNAMLLEYEKPGTLDSANGDDEYLARVNQYGDTTDAYAQVKALQSYGIDCDFVTNAGWDEIEDQLAKGHPVPVGWLHKGNLNGSGPSGGGHWSLVVGTEGENLVVHDPFGEANLLGGGYVSTAPTAGRYVRYSRKNFGPRWMVEGPFTGWMIQVR